MCFRRPFGLHGWVRPGSGSPFLLGITTHWRKRSQDPRVGVAAGNADLDLVGLHPHAGALSAVSHTQDVKRPRILAYIVSVVFAPNSKGAQSSPVRWV